MKPQGPKDMVRIIIYVSLAMQGHWRPAPVMDIVVSRQRHSTSLAGGQPGRA